MCTCTCNWLLISHTLLDSILASMLTVHVHVHTNLNDVCSYDYMYVSCRSIHLNWIVSRGKLSNALRTTSQSWSRPIPQQGRL